MRKTAWEVANEVKLERQVNKRTLLIIEGKNDARIFPKFIDDKHCTIIVADGKPNTMKAVEYLRDWGIMGYISVVDSDFDRLNGVDNSSDDIIVTEFHDIDLVVFESTALTHFLRERADIAKLQSFGTPVEVKVRELVYRAALGLGCLRHLSERHSWNLRFQDLDFRFIPKENLHYTDEQMVDAVLRNSPSARCSRSQVLNALAVIRRTRPRP
jgi:hypothetical protein